MAEIYAVNALCAPDRTLMNCEENPIALMQWYDDGPRLHPWPLLRQHKFAAREISLRFR